MRTKGPQGGLYAVVLAGDSRVDAVWGPLSQEAAFHERTFHSVRPADRQNAAQRLNDLGGWEELSSDEIARLAWMRRAMG